MQAILRAIPTTDRHGAGDATRPRDGIPRRARPLILALAGAAWLVAGLALPVRGTADTARGPAVSRAAPMPMLRAAANDDDRSRAHRTVSAPDPDQAKDAPTSLADLSSWLNYKTRNHLTALPFEARVFFRRGLMMKASGSPEEATRLVRGAAELDPTYVAPHLTLAWWFLVPEPGQALQQYASVLEMMRQNFALQLTFTANMLYLVLQSLFFGLLAAGLILLGLHQPKLRHAWQERLSTMVSPDTARWWAWGLLLLPYAVGFGVALPTVVLLGLLWPHFRMRERTLFVLLTGGLVMVPALTAGVDRLSAPLREDRAPFYGVPLLQTRPDAAAQRGRITELVAREPDNGLLQFAAGWLARRDGDLATAEKSYRRVLTLWPKDDRALNNLGNVLASQGRVDEALACYRQATAVNPANASAHFNASQIYTLRYDYHEATDELSRASAINFELVKTHQSQASDDGWLPLADQWIAPPALWRMLSTVSTGGEAPVLPPLWRSRVECSGLPFSLFALLLAVLACLFGNAWQRRIPLRACSNCDRTVCRRCSERSRERALCPTCAAIGSRAESPEFGRVLLLQHRRLVRGRNAMTRTTLAALVPGYGLLSFRRVFGPILILSALAALFMTGAGLAVPYAYEPRLMVPGPDLPLPLMAGIAATLYLLSLAGYLSREQSARAQAAMLDAPVRSRSTQATSHLQSAA